MVKLMSSAKKELSLIAQAVFSGVVWSIVQVLGFKVVFLHKTPPSTHALGPGKLLLLAGLASVLQHLVISQSEASTVTHQPIRGQYITIRWW